MAFLQNVVERIFVWTNIYYEVGEQTDLVPAEMFKVLISAMRSAYLTQFYASQ